MTTTVSTPSSVIPEPRRPWLATPRQRAEVLAVIFIAALVDIALVAATPLKGKLAYVGLYLIIYPLMDYSVVRAQRGKSAGSDALFRALVNFAMAIAVLPIASIVWTVLLLRLSLLRSRLVC